MNKTTPQASSLWKRYHNLILPLLACLFYALHTLLLRSQVQNIFAQDITMGRTQQGALFVSALFGIAVYTAFLYGIFLLLTQNSVFLSYLKEFVFYLIPMLFLLLLVFPGIFKGDEFYVLQAVRRLCLSPAQTGITSLFYIACLRFFPSLSAIPFFQIIIICWIYAYIFKNLRELYPGRRLWLCRIVFFLLPVLDGNLFTLRATLAGWIFLLIMTVCFFSYKKGRFSLKTLCAVSLLLGLLTAWRSEYVYLFLCIPPAAAWIFKKTAKHTLLFFALILLCFELFQIPNKAALAGSNKYPISLVINPLGNIFAQEEIRGEHAYDDIMTVNELIDVQALRQHPSVRNISQYWNIPDILPKEQLHAFMAASLRLIFNNFDRFLYYRWLTFCHTNGLYADEINHPTAPTAETIYTLCYYDEDYRRSYYFAEPLLGDGIRNAVIDVLACRHYDNENTRTTLLYPVFYNCLPTLFVLLAALLASLIRKKYVLSGILFLTGAQTVLIFLTAPAMFFMYYFCFYLAGYFFSALTVTELSAAKKESSAQTS